MFTVVNKDGKVLYCRECKSQVDGEISIPELYSSEWHDDAELYFDFNSKTFYWL